MRFDFTKRACEALLEEGLLRRDARLLAVCAGRADQELFEQLRLDVTLTNIDIEAGAQVDRRGRGSGQWQVADAQDLPFRDRSFDVGFVADGVHHCRDPHRAVTELLRVSSDGVILVETRDSLLVRLGRRLGVVSEYEMNRRLLKTRTRGGADFGPIPNYVYRWTERDFEKTVRCFEPEHVFTFRYFYGLSVPARSELNKLARIVRRQGNLFGMAAFRTGRQPYLDGSRLRDDVNEKSAVGEAPSPTRRRTVVSAE